MCRLLLVSSSPSVKERHFTDIISSVADKLGSFLCGTTGRRGDPRVRAPTYPRRLTRVTFMQGRSGCCCVGWEGWARTCDNAVNSHALHELSTVQCGILILYNLPRTHNCASSCVFWESLTRPSRIGELPLALLMLHGSSARERSEVRGHRPRGLAHGCYSAVRIE